MGIVYTLEKYLTRYYRRKIEKKYQKEKKIPSPDMVTWDSTRECNLNCEHCGATEENYEDRLDTEEVKEFINTMSEIGSGFLSITGGEPLLREDIFRILEHAESKNVKTGLATNGFFVDQETADKLQNKVHSVQISLDGKKETHNSIKNNDLSFQKATEALELLKERKIPVLMASTTVTKTNIDELEDIKKHLIELEIKNWRINPLMPIGRGKDEQLFPDKDHFRKLFEFIENTDSVNIKIGENLPYLGEKEENIRNRPNLCPVGINACCIGVEGNVRGCPEMPDTEKFIEGNIREESFKNIWQKRFEKYRTNKILKEDSRCSKCDEKYNCYGGCWVMRQAKYQCIRDLI